MKKKILLLLLTIFLFGCNDDMNSKNDNDALTVFATIYPLAFFAEEIGGDYVNIETVLPPGADPHHYEPTSRMMVNIAEADLFLFNGANLESYANKMKNALNEEEVLMVETSQGISLDKHEHKEETDKQQINSVSNEEKQDNDDDHTHRNDPHIWLDPIRSIEIANNIKEALIELHPDQTKLFEDNFMKLEEKLMELDNRFHEQLNEAPTKDILVTHAAYTYWEQSYGLNQISVSGLSSSEEPSQKQLEQILDYVKENNTQYLLFEQNVKPKVARVIQEETGIQSLELHNLSVLTEKNIDDKETYFTLMEQNLDVLVKALNND